MHVGQYVWLGDGGFTTESTEEGKSALSAWGLAGVILAVSVIDLKAYAGRAGSMGSAYLFSNL
jgi:hypothetical protein